MLKSAAWLAERRAERAREDAFTRAAVLVVSCVDEDRGKMLPLAMGFVAGVVQMRLDLEMRDTREGREALEKLYADFPGLEVQVEELVR